MKEIAFIITIFCGSLIIIFGTLYEYARRGTNKASDGSLSRAAGRHAQLYFGLITGLLLLTVVVSVMVYVKYDR